MSIAAALLGAWAAWRWIGFVAGLVRLLGLDGATRREARRTLIGHGAIDVFFSVCAIYLWALALDAQPTETFVAFMAATVMISLAVGVASRLMQPPVRLPHTIGIARILAATPDTPVEPVGTPTHTDASGAFVPEVVDEIEAPWDTAVARYADLVEQRARAAVHSVYVRGSIAKGMAVEHRSDLDGVVVLDGRPDPGWRDGIEAGVRDEYPFVTEVEVLAIDRAEVFADRGLNLWAFLLATQAVCVRGPDLRAELPRFGFGPWAFLQAPSLPSDIDEVLAERSDDPEETRDTCAWIMKRIVRTAFESVMVEEGTYTRDLYLCYETFRRHHADRADELWQALELAVEPTSDRAVIDEVCRGIGAWVAERGARAYKRARDHGGMASALPGEDHLEQD